ncbi:hypothetical protein Scep_026749 [Stephania cephalantha]|uniref:Uncharacterized protein n=1 Tax=Stephania cephalantha TaxID=152367 RepID=A0AAP0HTL0_9MAGN
MSCGATSAILSVIDAFGVVLRVTHRLKPTKVPIHEALGKDDYATVASDGPDEYLVITESRAGNDAVRVTVTSGTVAYVETGGGDVMGPHLSFMYFFSIRGA